MVYFSTSLHRLKSKGKPSPIIVKFSFYKDRDTVLKKYRDMRKAEREANAGKNDNAENENEVDLEPAVRIGEDFPYRVRNVRRKLIPFLKKSISEGKEAFLKYDKLCVEGDLYKYCEENKCPILIEK